MSKITVDEVLVKLLNKFDGFAQQIRQLASNDPDDLSFNSCRIPTNSNNEKYFTINSKKLGDIVFYHKIKQSEMSYVGSSNTGLTVEDFCVSVPLVKSNSGSSDEYIIFNATVIISNSALSNVKYNVVMSDACPTNGSVDISGRSDTLSVDALSKYHVPSTNTTAKPAIDISTIGADAMLLTTMYSIYDCLVETSNILHMSGDGTLGVIFECLNDEDN